MGGNVRKGNRLQVMARKLLEAEGYVVHTAVRTSTMVGRPGRSFWISQSNDVFNAFDLIATRMSAPKPLRFVQVTTAKMVSERVKKVDPIPVNPRSASVEIWAYVGGQPRLDRRYKDRRVWLPRNYFQVYYKERNWQPDPADRLFASDTSATVGVEENPIPPQEPVEVANPRRHPKGAQIESSV